MTPEWYEKAEEMFLKHNTYKAISEEVGVHRKTVSKWLRKCGHKTDPKNIRNKTTHPKKYSLNEDLFEEIDSEEKAYWLGFLYADGYVNDFKNDIELGLAEKDREHIEKFKSFLNATAPINVKTKKTGTSTCVGYRIRITSKKMKTDLIQKGCTPVKSQTLKFPTEEQVPEYLLVHFIRGYFDGDGCVTHANKGRQIAAEILGTKEFIEKLIEWTDLEVNIHSFNHSPTTYRVQFFGPKAESFLKRIYEKPSTCLERKYRKYVNFAPTTSDCDSVSTKIGEP